MKKILTVLLVLIGASVYAQPMSGFKVIWDTLQVQRADITALLDTAGVHDAKIKALEDSVGVHDAAIKALSGGSTDYLPKSGGTMLGNIKFNDNIKATFGTGTEDDLEIYHNGTGGYIVQDDGDFTIKTVGDNLYLGTGATLDWKIGVNGNLLPNAATLDIGSPTSQVDSGYFGDLRIYNRLTMGDADYVYMGASGDMLLGHSGSANLLTFANADLNINSTTAHAILFTTNGAERFQVSSAGNLIPKIHNTYSIGSSSYYIASTYTTNLYLGSSMIVGAKTLSTTELGVLDGILASTAELNILDGVTASYSEINILDGLLPSQAELNRVDGVTSPIQTQLDAKLDSLDLAGIITDTLDAQIEYRNFPISYPQTNMEVVPMYIGKKEIVSVTASIDDPTGGKTVTFNLRRGTNLADTGSELFSVSKTCSLSTIQSFGVPNLEEQILATHYIWVDVGAVNGLVKMFIVTIGIKEGA